MQCHGKCDRGDEELEGDQGNGGQFDRMKN